MIKYICSICGIEIIDYRQREKICECNWHNCLCSKCEDEKERVEIEELKKMNEIVKEAEQKIRKEEFDNARKNADRRVKEFGENKLKKKRHMKPTEEGDDYVILSNYKGKVK